MRKAPRASSIPLFVLLATAIPFGFVTACSEEPSPEKAPIVVDTSAEAGTGTGAPGASTPGSGTPGTPTSDGGASSPGNSSSDGGSSTPASNGDGSAPPPSTSGDASTPNKPNSDGSAPPPPPTSSTGSVDTCAWVPESHNTADLSCPAGQVISRILFASWGSPVGLCPAMTYGDCNSTDAMTVAQTTCLGKQSCSLPANSNAYGDPCAGRSKIIAVEASCGTSVDNTPVTPPPPPPANHVCVAVLESHLSADITCPSGQVVKSIAFASWGNASGACGAFKVGSCNAPTSVSETESLCLGQSSCSVPANSNTFGGDPCSGVAKTMVVDAVCGP